MTRKQGFSITELLVVIAIIMLLIAIILPVMRSVKLSAYKVVCASRLSQIGMALEMYSHDYRGYFPKEEDMAPYPPGRSWSHWGMKIEPYIEKLVKTKGYRTHKIMECPAYNDTYINSWSNSHFAYNSHLGLSAAISGNNFTPRFLPYEYRPRIAIIADGYAYFSIWSTTRVYFRHDTMRPNNYEGPAGVNRQGGTTNALFGDLRVENLKEVPNSMRNW